MTPTPVFSLQRLKFAPLLFVLVFVEQTVAQALPPKCLPILEGDFAEYYEIHGKTTDLLPYRANINKSIEETFTDNHFLGEQFRILVSDLNPENVALLVKYPKKYRFYSLDKEEYFTREFEQVDYEHIFVFKNVVFYAHNGYFLLNSTRVDEDLTEQNVNISASTEIKLDELWFMNTRCWKNDTHCYVEGDRIVDTPLDPHFVVYTTNHLRVMAIRNSNELYIHDLVTGFDFCFPDTLKTHKDCENADKFSRVQTRFPVVRAGSPFLQRRYDLVGKSFAEAQRLSVKKQAGGCEPRQA
ncbi:hypothetical protein M3Y99_00683800 [Aphelenchoides fujianensis]|nr:hypothetical protein M3Y99_00683800 [Aphelenchoides fujianensis]